MNAILANESSDSLETKPSCVVVIFGATGDLTARKLVPSLYQLLKRGLLSEEVAYVGVARREKTNQQFREEMKHAIQTFSNQELDIKVWEQFESRLFYHQSSFSSDEGYKSLKEFLSQIDLQLNTKGNRLFYLATPPEYFPEIIKKLSTHQLCYKNNSQNSPWSRVIIEKPFGSDLQSAKKLQSFIDQYLYEDNVYRIDHYLGKETVQNLLTLRFANTLFESAWNSQYIDHVQISVSENIGIGSRGNFFEKSGTLRDMVQNHLIQLLTLLTIDPPTAFSSEEIKKEKLKVLKKIRPIGDKDIVRGQYTSGNVQNVSVCGYREENNVDPKSNVETFVALKLFIDNSRWLDVPFYLRVGKRLAKRSTEISIIFKPPFHALFYPEACPSYKVDNDLLVIRIQPDEGVSLQFNCKVPGMNNLAKPVKMDFRYEDYFQTTTSEAYERLIYDCILGDRILFTGDDEVLASWELFTPIIESWAKSSESVSFYPAGSSGPKESDALIQNDNRSWRPI